METGTPKPVYDENKIYLIPLEDIYADEEFNCRGFIPPLDVFELAREIKTQGLIQPITVQPWTKKADKRFRIVAGYRRFKAHLVNALENNRKLAPDDTIRCTIKEGLSEFDARAINLSENLSRRDLNILQEAKAINPFYQRGWNIHRIATKINQHDNWVKIRIALLELPVELQMEAAAGMLNGQQILELAGLSDEKAQLEFFRAIKDAKILGKKAPKINRVLQKSKKEVRDLDQIVALQDTLFDTFNLEHPDARLAIQVLGWATGRIDDLSIHKMIKEYADEGDLDYKIPDSLVQ